MQHRAQRTIRRAVETTGVGFLTGADVTIRFLPAPPNHGIAFQRIDCRSAEPIPALIDFAVPRQRRTAIERHGVTIEMTEHVMAALAGLWIDNCLVQLNAPEPPGCDGSSLAFVDALLEVGIVELDDLRDCLAVATNAEVRSDDGRSRVAAQPLSRPALSIAYELDYGPESPIPAQSFTLNITPETFLRELVFARTFVLESEVAALRAQGYGRRTTPKDLLVFGKDGVIENRLRTPDECARHKILDCIGDFALIGCDVHGHFAAFRSGHRLNRAMVRELKRTHASLTVEQHARAA